MTKLHVLQIAALDLGVKPPTDANGPGNTLAILNARYDSARREFIADHSWIKNTAFYKCNKMTVAPAFNWSAQFDTPADMLRVVKVNGVDADAGEDAFRVAPDSASGATVILTNTDEVNLEYIRDTVDVSHFSPKQLVAFGHFLALQVAEANFGKDNAFMNRLKEKFEESMADARAIDSQQGTQPRRTRSVVMRARTRRF